MIRHRLLLPPLPTCLLWLLIPLGVCAAEDSDQALADAIAGCDSCHAPQSRVRSMAPVLNGMSGRYLEDQLENFLLGARGNADTDHFTGQMIDQLTALSATQRDRVIRHYARQDSFSSPETVAGDAALGAPLFEEHCAGCHTSAMGRRFTGSPRITQLNGPYILAQLQAFADGSRGFVDPGKHQLRMVEVAKGFDEAELLAITAYAKTLTP